MDLGGELAIIRHAMVLRISLGFLDATGSLYRLPLSSHVTDLGLPVSLRVVGLVETAEALPQTQMPRVHCDAVVLVSFVITDISPATLLLLEIEAGSIWEEEPGEEHANEAEPRNNVEFGLVADIVVKDRGEESTSLTHTGRETVGGGTNGSGENLASNEESDGVGAKLVKER